MRIVETPMIQVVLTVFLLSNFNSHETLLVEATNRWACWGVRCPSEALVVRGGSLDAPRHPSLNDKGKGRRKPVIVNESDLEDDEEEEDEEEEQEVEEEGEEDEEEQEEDGDEEMDDEEEEEQEETLFEEVRQYEEAVEEADDEAEHEDENRKEQQKEAQDEQEDEEIADENNEFEDIRGNPLDGEGERNVDDVESTTEGEPMDEEEVFHETVESNEDEEVESKNDPEDDDDDDSFATATDGELEETDESEETQPVEDSVDSQMESTESIATSEDAQMPPADESSDSLDAEPGDDSTIDTLVSVLMYSREEAENLRPNVAAELVRNTIKRPSGGIPPSWFVDEYAPAEVASKSVALKKSKSRKKVRRAISKTTVRAVLATAVTVGASVLAIALRPSPAPVVEGRSIAPIPVTPEFVDPLLMPKPKAAPVKAKPPKKKEKKFKGQPGDTWLDRGINNIMESADDFISNRLNKN